MSTLKAISGLALIMETRVGQTAPPSLDHRRDLFLRGLDYPRHKASVKPDLTRHAEYCSSPTFCVPQATTIYGLCGKQKALAGRSSVCYNVPTEAGGGLVAVLSFFAFVALVGTGILTLDYVLSSLDKETVGRRCRVPHQTHRRQTVRRQRVRCRHEG